MTQPQGSDSDADMRARMGVGESAMRTLSSFDAELLAAIAASCDAIERVADLALDKGMAPTEMGGMVGGMVGAALVQVQERRS